MSEICKVVSRQAEELSETVLTPEEKKRIEWKIVSILFAGMLLLVGKGYEYFYPGYDSVIGFVLLVGAIIGGADIFHKALKGLISQEDDYIMEQLVALALFASIAKGNYQVAILIPLVMAFVHFLEERSILGAQSAIDGLSTLQDKDARVIVSGVETVVSSKELKCGDIIRVHPGEMIAADGEVIEGKSSIDQSSMTGESLPVEAVKGVMVFAGTVNIQGVLLIRVSSENDETALSKIVELLRKTEQSKIPVMRIIEKYSSYYLPFVILFATAVFFLSQSMDRAITVLVVSCPCAQLMVSSTAMIAALSVSSRHGILLKNSKFLEFLGDVKTVIFDKTGTLTSGNLYVTMICPQEGVSEQSLLSCSASAAWLSNHPVSMAIVKAAEELSYDKGYTVSEISGMGVEALKEQETILLGKRAFLEDRGLELSAETEKAGTTVWVACNGRVLGYFLLSDKVRSDAAETTKELRAIGIERITMVTGDRYSSAITIHEQLKLDDIYTGCMPAEKLDIVSKEKESSDRVLVVGDGINDALALSKADVGIAMGGMGADIAVQSSDIALMGNELKKIPLAIRLSRATKKIVFQNMFIASASSITMITLASTGMINPLVGAFLHNVGAFLVLLNSSRLMRFETSRSS